MDEQIWGALYDAERLNRYYERLAGRYRRLHFWFNMAIALGTLVAALMFFTDLPKLVSAILFALVSGAVIWTTFAGYARKSAAAENASALCAEVRVLLTRVWHGVDYTSNESGRVLELQQRMQNATLFVRLDVDADLNERCSKDASEVLRTEFAR